MYICNSISCFLKLLLLFASRHWTLLVESFPLGPMQSSDIRTLNQFLQNILDFPPQALIICFQYTSEWRMTTRVKGKAYLSCQPDSGAYFCLSPVLISVSTDMVPPCSGVAGRFLMLRGQKVQPTPYQARAKRWKSFAPGIKTAHNFNFV